MSFNVDGIIVEEILSVLAEDFDGKPLYRIIQASEGNLDVTAETKEAKDKNGTLIKKSYTAKAASLSITNAMLDLNAYAHTTGSDKIVASEDNKIKVPKLLLVDSGDKSVVLPDEPIDGTITVTAVKSNDSLGKTYDLSAASAATADEYAYNKSTNSVTLPIDFDTSEVSEFLIKYEYITSNAVMIEQKGDKFPDTVKLIVQVLYGDECNKGVSRLAYIIIPKFQVSPETSMQMKTDSTFEFKGDAQMDYCSKNKRLYYIVFPDGDVKQ